jgi:hypothetical protein
MLSACSLTRLRAWRSCGCRGEGVERRGADDLDGLLDGRGVVWVEVPEWATTLPPF